MQPVKWNILQDLCMCLCVCVKKMRIQKVAKDLDRVFEWLMDEAWFYADWFGNAIENGKQMKCDNAEEETIQQQNHQYQ